MSFRGLKRWIGDLIREFNSENTLQLSASLSYYTLLSFAPLVLVIVSLAGLVFDRTVIEEQFAVQMRSLIGVAGADVLQTVIQNGTKEAKGFALIIGLVTLFIGASTVFVQLQDALNQIWDVEKDPKLGAVRKAILSRVLSLAMVISIGFLLLVSLLASTAIAVAQGWVHTRMSIPDFVWRVVDLIISFGMVTLLVAAVFKILPSVKLTWRDVWFGAAITSGLFTLGKWGIGEYLGRASIGSAYGAAGSIVVLMVWTYYASLIFFVGAMITRMRRRPEAKSGTLQAAH